MLKKIKKTDLIDRAKKNRDVLGEMWQNNNNENFIMQMIYKTETKNKEIEEKVSQLKKYVNSGGYEQALIIAKKISDGSLQIKKHIDTLHRYIIPMVEIEAEPTISELLENAYGIHIKIDGDILTIKLDDPLPHRQSIDYRSGKPKYISNIAERARCYNTAMEIFLNQRGMPFYYNEKVVIKITNYYKGKGYDLDNLDPKIVIDLVRNYFLQDDSFEYCSYYMEGVIGDDDRCKITVIPEKNLKI